MTLKAVYTYQGLHTDWFHVIINAFKDAALTLLLKHFVLCVQIHAVIGFFIRSSLLYGPKLFACKSNFSRYFPHSFSRSAAPLYLQLDCS